MQKIITNSIIALIFFLLLLLLCGCAKTTPVSENIADNAINATTALEQSLPTECKTEAITTQLVVIKTQIKAITNACETEKSILNQDKTKWKVGFWALIGLIIAYIFRRLTK